MADNTEKPKAQTAKDIPWCKSLKSLPVFTRKEIDEHRNNSGKRKADDVSKPIKKTLKRGLKFQEERYLSSDTVYTKVFGNSFMVKAKCRASMSTREIHELEVSPDVTSGNVREAHCTCRAGKSGYCNHVMSLLLELARYSLEDFDRIPEEAACTSMSRKWGIPGEKGLPKEPIMKTSVQKELTNKGIKPTLYDPRVKERKRLDIRGVQVMQKELESIHPLIGFSHVIPKKPELLTNIDTRYGPVVIGSPLSFHLSSLEFNFTVVTNLEPAVNPAQADSSDIYKVSLPLHFPDLPEAVHFSTVQQTFIEHLRVTHQESIDIEKRTVKQRECDEWIKHRKNRLGSSVCHRIYVRKRSFNNLAKELNQPFKPLDEIPVIQQRKLKHGIKFEPVAREKYYDVMKHYLKRPITLRETGMVIPPCMFWLEGSPDGLVIDPCSSSGKIGTIEMKCPEGKKNHTPEEAMQDESFYIELVDGKPNLKKDHHLGYYTQVQLVMGFCGLEWVDFVVYLFKGMIITRVPFNKDYFDQVVCKVNIFYVKWFLPQVMA